MNIPDYTLKIKQFWFFSIRPNRVKHNPIYGVIVVNKIDLFGVMSMGKILLVDDENTITDINERYLNKEGYDVYVARDGQDALLLYASVIDFDLIITDIMMPNVDGYEFIDSALDINPDQPFLFITAKSNDQDKFYSLGMGADDYIVKPFNPRELVLRVNNILNRIRNVRGDQETDQKIGDLQISFDRRAVSINDHELILTLKEFDILSLLVRHNNKILSKVEIYSKVWNETFMEDDNSLNVHIYDLRKKIKQWATNNTPTIETVWGMGYRMRTNL